jgi:hypothetical protein
MTARCGRLNPLSTQQHEQTFPRKHIFTTILKIRCNLLIYNEKVGRLATEFSTLALVCAEKIFSYSTRGPKTGPVKERICPNIRGRPRTQCFVASFTGKPGQELLSISLLLLIQWMSCHPWFLVLAVLLAWLFGLLLLPQ